MKNKILEYLKEQLFDSDIDEDIEGDTDLLGSGILDSLAMVQLIAFVEEEFDVSVAPEDMVIENFMTIDHICNYLESK